MFGRSRQLFTPPPINVPGEGDLYVKIETTMANAIPLALKRKPEERGSFDKLTIGELEKNLKNWIMDAEYNISTFEDRQNQFMNDVQQCQDKLEKAQSEAADASSMLDTV